ncbi:MAG: S9 family peptidase [Acidobacteria bacterium]|nr:MAG: S9 family peptidase [Acidobacteriota bacterium]
MLPSRSRCPFASVGLLALVTALLAPAPTVEAGEKRAFTIEDLYRVVYVPEFALSPDGRWIAYVKRERDLPRGKQYEDIWLLPASGGEPRRLTHSPERSESSLAWSPDGRFLAFVAEKEEKDQIWLLPMEGGEPYTVTDIATGAEDLLFSPDGRSIAFTSEVYPECGADDACNREIDEKREKGPLKAHVADRLFYRHWTRWWDGKVPHVLVLDLETRQVRDLTPERSGPPQFYLWSPRSYAFSPDGRRFAFQQNPGPPEELAWSTNDDLFVVPLSGDAPARDITADNPAYDGTPRFSPDGSLIAYRRQRQPGYESDEYELAVRAVDGGEERILTAHFDNWVDDFAWFPDGEALLFLAEEHGATPLYRVPLNGGPLEKIVEHATIDSFAIAPDGKTVYAVRRAIAEPPEIWAYDLTGGSPRRLTFHNAKLEREVDIRPAERLWLPGAGDYQVECFLIKPHDFDPSRKYPLILNVHGGPQSQWADAFRGDWQVYPGAGYIVAFPNPTGSTGYGQAFTAAISRDWGGRVYRDVMRVADSLEKLPYVDKDRMGAMGWSYGGYMMNWLLGHTTRFKAIATMMGLFDLRSFYGATEELWFPEWDLGGRPWDSPLYERFNPARFADRMQTPTLVITGELDYRVPYTQGLQLFTALQRRGVPSRLIVFPEAGHWPGWYEMALYYTAHLDWFHRWLGGGGPPWSVEDFAANRVFDTETGKRIDRAGSEEAPPSER